MAASWTQPLQEIWFPTGVLGIENEEVEVILFGELNPVQIWCKFRKRG
jgi:hypothetical protein